MAESIPKLQIWARA